jgi:hypothetical protein
MLEVEHNIALLFASILVKSLLINSILLWIFLQGKRIPHAS